ncbi:MAG: isochorismatase family protein [Candidatus Thermoplasmatota archaeon]
MKPVLLVIDVQNFVLDMYPGYSDSVKKHAKTMNDAIALFRAKGLPLVVVYHEDRELGPRPGTRAFAFHESIDVRDSDPRVVKNYPNGFNKTSLADTLKGMGCDTVFIVGLSAVGCAMATYHGAIDLDLEPYFVQDGVAADTEEHVRMAEEICRTINMDELGRKLG